MPFEQEGKADVLVGPLKMTLPVGTMRPDDIRLWPENPRIRHILARIEGFASEEDVMAAIRASAPKTYRDLHKDIEKFGQSVPVFVKSEHRDGGQVQVATVYEGATRVTILKELHRRYPRESRFLCVKTYMLPDSFSDQQLAILLANYHVKRALHRNPWDRYQIGAFLYEEIDRTGRFTGQEMAEVMGMSPSWVSRHLTIYRFALEYRDELEATYGCTATDAESETADKLSLLEEAWKVKRFRDRFDDDPDAKPTLFKWVHEGKFTDHRKIRAIDDVYADERARREVEAGGTEAGDQVAARLEHAHPLHDELEKVARIARGIAISELDGVDRRRVKAAILALEHLDSLLERLGAGR